MPADRAPLPVLPSLLDRLTDDDPSALTEAVPDLRAAARRYQQGVRRDLAWLLNSASFEAGRNLEGLPEVRQSVLNFGMPDMSGKTMTLEDVEQLADDIKKALLVFEPRLNAATVEVSVVGEVDDLVHNSISYDIKGELWALPTPIQLLLRTEIDLEAGDVRLADLYANRG